MSKQVIHPLTGHVYRLTEDGLVEVTDPATGAQGLFDFQARHRQRVHECRAIGLDGHQFA